MSPMHDIRLYSWVQYHACCMHVGMPMSCHHQSCPLAGSIPRMAGVHTIIVCRLQKACTRQTNGHAKDLLIGDSALLISSCGC